MALQNIVAGAILFAAGPSLQGCGDGGATTTHAPTPSPHPSPGPTPSPTPDPSPGPSPPAPSPADTTTPAPPPPPPPPSPCVALPDKPPVPDTVLDLNGAEYPQACYELKEDGNHFFVIGDWGGMCGWTDENVCGVPGHTYGTPIGTFESIDPRPLFDQSKRGGRYVQGIDDTAQQRVAAAMDAIAAQVPPEFVVSVGDNFYPGGIAEHCNGVGSSYDFTKMPHQFNSTFESIYDSPHMQNKEWMGVLGNHDYGGRCLNAGWPQQVYYTWNQVSKRWVLPAQYYYRNLRFSKGGSDDWDDDDFSIDMFFLDANVADTGAGDHDMCNTQGNTDPAGDCPYLGENDDGMCAGTPGLWGSQQICDGYFHQLWTEQMVWLEDLLDKSTADWQMIVMHYPPHYGPVRDLTPLVEKYGVDLIMAGHSHFQQVWYQQKFIDYDIGDTAWVISGGGGGITSEGAPTVDYNIPCEGEGEDRVCDQATGNDDQYGFMDMVITKDNLSIRPYSWGKKVDGSQIMRHGAEVSPRPRADLRDARPVKPNTEVV